MNKLLLIATLLLSSQTAFAGDSANLAFEANVRLNASADCAGDSSALKSIVVSEDLLPGSESNSLKMFFSYECSSGKKIIGELELQKIGNDWIAGTAAASVAKTISVK